MDIPDAKDVKEWFDVCKSGLGLFRDTLSFLPAGPQRDNAQRTLDEAEVTLQRSNALLAKALGYHLCKCTLPPQPMLWVNAEQAHVCPRPECGNKISQKPTNPYKGPSWQESRTRR